MGALFSTPSDFSKLNENTQIHNKMYGNMCFCFLNTNEMIGKLARKTIERSIEKKDKTASEFL